MNHITLAAQAVLHTVFADADGTTLKTNSRFVAEVFGRQHKDVLKAITNLDCSEEFRQRNFALSSYLNAQGKEQPMVEMSFDGFTFLVMGFTGAKAAAFKEAYIAEFNRMRAALAQATAKQIATLEKFVRLPIVPLTAEIAAQCALLLAQRMPIADVARVCRQSQATVRLLRRQALEGGQTADLFGAGHE